MTTPATTSTRLETTTPATSRARRPVLVTALEACEILGLSIRSFRRLREIGNDLAHVTVHSLGGPKNRTQMFLKSDIVSARKALTRKVPAKAPEKAPTKGDTK